MAKYLIYVFDILRLLLYTMNREGEVSDSKFEKRNTISSNLRDAGCGEEFISKFITLPEQEGTGNFFEIPPEYKASLLAAAHKRYISSIT